MARRLTWQDGKLKALGCQTCGRANLDLCLHFVSSFQTFKKLLKYRNGTKPTSEKKGPESLIHSVTGKKLYTPHIIVSNKKQKCFSKAIGHLENRKVIAIHCALSTRETSKNIIQRGKHNCGGEFLRKDKHRRWSSTSTKPYNEQGRSLSLSDQRTTTDCLAVAKASLAIP